jgi:hypothetical protein
VLGEIGGSIELQENVPEKGAAFLIKIAGRKSN